MNRSAATDDGLTLLMAVEPDPAHWPLHLDLAGALAELGIRSVLASTGAGLTEQQKKAAAGVRGLSLVDAGHDIDPRNPDFGVKEAGTALARLARAVGADIVQLDDGALAAAARFDCPLVALHHGCAVTSWERVKAAPLPVDLSSRSDLLRAGLHAAHAVVCPTAAHGRMVQQLFGLPNLPHIANIGRTPLGLRGAAQHDYVFTAGRLWEDAGNFTLLDAAARRISVPVRAAGPVNGPNGDPLLFENLHCLGELPEQEIIRWLTARPVFVSTALCDPIGLSVLAAASASCALVLSDIPEHRELWDEVAIFVDPVDERGFSETIANLVGDDFERAVLGHAARERAALYTPQAMAAQMAALYRNLLPAVHRPVLAARAAA